MMISYHYTKIYIEKTFLYYILISYIMKVEWNQDKCIHSAECVKNLPAVFMVKDGKFIIEQEGAPQAVIRRVVRMCPSGALEISE